MEVHPCPRRTRRPKKQNLTEMKANSAARAAKNPAHLPLSVRPENLVIKLCPSSPFTKRGHLRKNPKKHWVVQIIRRVPDQGLSTVILQPVHQSPYRELAVQCALNVFAGFSKRNYPKWLKQQKGHLYPFMPDRLEKIRTKLEGGADYCALDQFYPGPTRKMSAVA